MSKFLTLVQQARNGGLLVEADHQLAEVIAWARENKKPVELTLKLKIKPQRSDDDEVRRVDVTGEVTGKTAKVEREETIFFFGVEDELTRMDPRQKEFDFRPQPVEADASQRLPKPVITAAPEAKKA